MIWNNQPRYEDEALVLYVSAEIASVCSGESPGISKDYQRELARAVTDFIRMEHPVDHIASEYLILLVARALWAVGEEEAARRLIALKGAELGFSALHTDVALTTDISLSLWRVILSSRAVRPSPLSGQAHGGIWVLDMQRAVARAENSLEITVFRVVNAVIEEIAALWDHSKGKGVLGLRHVNKMVSKMLKSPGKSAKTKAMTAEIQRRCKEKLQSLGKARGWKYIPNVMYLDL